MVTNGILNSTRLVENQFHKNQDKKLFEKYKNATDWLWVQEEPVNMGAWNFINKRFGKHCNLRVISRPESASPAPGSLKIHKKIQEQLVNEAFI